MAVNRRVIGVESARRVKLAGRRVRKGCPEVGGAMAWTAFSPVFQVEHFVLDIHYGYALL